MAGNNADTSSVARVVVATRRRVLSGEYAPGTRLRIHELAQTSGVSAIPVREALRILEAERLVESVPNRGPAVARLSIRDLNDLYIVRMQLEPLAVSMTKQLTPNEAKSLMSLLAELDEATEADDLEVILDLHRRFHFSLYERSESPWLLHLIAVLWSHAERYQCLSIGPRRVAASTEHLAMIRALESGAIAGAANLLHDHLESTRSLLEEVYSNSEGPEMGEVYASDTSRVASAPNRFSNDTVLD